jgi:hypothetical protein
MEKVLQELAATLVQWKTSRTWGCIEIEVQAGEVTLLRKETKQKFNSNGGFHHGPARIETR